MSFFQWKLSIFEFIDDLTVTNSYQLKILKQFLGLRSRRMGHFESFRIQQIIPFFLRSWWFRNVYISLLVWMTLGKCPFSISRQWIPFSWISKSLCLRCSASLVPQISVLFALWHNVCCSFWLGRHVNLLMAYWSPSARPVLSKVLWGLGNKGSQ